MKTPVFVILLAGGSGSRMGAGINKILLPIAGKPCIARSAEAFRGFADRMTIVCRSEETNIIKYLIDSLSLGFPVSYVPGGETRQQSVFCGLSTFPDEEAFILVHDGARCLVDSVLIRRLLDDMAKYGSGVASIPVTDTVKRINENESIIETLPRASLRAIQTPQGFRLQDLRKAYRKAELDGFEGTDDSSLMEHAGFAVHLSDGNVKNLKLTTKEDLIVAEAFAGNESTFPAVRVGIGYDVHQLTAGRKLILCGVDIPHSVGLLGHSDADVALHALMDALLGAAGLRDIGYLFPDSDPQYRGISSLKLLDIVMEKLQSRGFSPVNVDITIIAQAPRLSPFISQMRDNLAAALSLPVDMVNVKATTSEHLGFEGRKEGISAQAVCLIQKIP